MPDRAVMAALASPKRPHVLEWLLYPQMPFAAGCDGVDDGACVLFIATYLGVAQPTATAHMQAPALPR